jgi:hypothetical protein
MYLSKMYSIGLLRNMMTKFCNFYSWCEGDEHCVSRCFGRSVFLAEAKTGSVFYNTKDTGGGKRTCASQGQRCSSEEREQVFCLRCMHAFLCVTSPKTRYGIPDTGIFFLIPVYFTGIFLSIRYRPVRIPVLNSLNKSSLVSSSRSSRQIAIF